MIFIDESGSGLDLTPIFARAPQNQRAYGEKPTGGGPRISALGALSLQGLETALCFEGTLKGSVFLYDVEQFLLPYLRAGKAVILDNAAAHR
ncbi:hypothetical protein NOC27_3271 [Nitrosococcus oceani AFC27]|nr:hypothetical protein NOC27_3271 [Nitrosococcus oceani AFC27]GEM21330.1 hypothetical protein NONS58_27690 [Nitrosococcus oceani]